MLCPIRQIVRRTPAGRHTHYYTYYTGLIGTLGLRMQYKISNHEHRYDRSPHSRLISSVLSVEGWDDFTPSLSEQNPCSTQCGGRSELRFTCFFQQGKGQFLQEKFKGGRFKEKALPELHKVER